MAGGARPGSSGRDGRSSRPGSHLQEEPDAHHRSGRPLPHLRFHRPARHLADCAAALRAEAGAAIRDAYAATFDERVTDGISGHYLPMAARLTPVSASLVCDDPRLIDAAGQLLGGPVIPECPEGVLYFFEAGWHTDDGIGVRGIKFATYFGELTADNGALRLVPGSHHPEQNARLAAYSRRRGPARGEAAAYQASIPGYIADTSPGD